MHKALMVLVVGLMAVGCEAVLDGWPEDSGMTSPTSYGGVHTTREFTANAMGLTPQQVRAWIGKPYRVGLVGEETIYIWWYKCQNGLIETNSQKPMWTLWMTFNKKSNTVTGINYREKENFD